MNTKQFLLLATSLACTTSGASAATIQMTEIEIAQAIQNKEMGVGTVVLYKGAVYTVDNFDVTTNKDAYTHITYKLETPFELFGTELGKNIVDVTVTEGTEPLYPHREVMNENATNDTRYAVDTYHYRTYNDKYRILSSTAAGISMGAISFLYFKLLKTIILHK